MATQKIAMGINLRQNKIEGSSAYGKYYPEVDQQKTLSLRGFAQHMTDHGSLYGRAIVEGVLLQITECPGRRERMTKKETLKWTLQILASIISAVLTALGTTSCMGV